MEGTPLSAAQRGEIETLLTEGRREEALVIALQLKQYALAMLIGTVCGKEHFQSAVRSYADTCLDHNSALHFMSLLYSNQASTAMQTPAGASAGNRAGTGGAIGGAVRKCVSWADASPFVQSWRQHLSCILLNKTSDWVEVVRQLGERVYAETNVSVPKVLILSAYVCFVAVGHRCGPHGFPYGGISSLGYCRSGEVFAVGLRWRIALPSVRDYAVID